MFILFSFFFARPSDPPSREGREGGRWETKNISWGWPYIFTAWPLILQIFLAHGFMLFFSRGYLSQLQISFNFNQSITGKVYIILDTKAQGHQSWKVPPWGVSGLGTKTFPPNTRQVHCCSIYKMADEIQQPAKKRRKTEKTGSDLDDKLESKQQSEKKSGEIEKLNSLYTIFLPSSQQFSYKSCILKLFLQVKMWIVATTLKKRWGKHSKLNFPPIFSIFGIFAKIWKMEIHVVSLLSVSTPLASIYD